MTKEELKKEAEEYVKKILEGTEFEDDEMDVCAYTKREMLEAILHFAEPREKRIEELEKKIKSLEGNSSLHEGILWNDIHNQDKKIAELEAQIEKMKCCENCRYCNEWGEANSNSPNCKKCNWVSNWELRR